VTPAFARLLDRGPVRAIVDRLVGGRRAGTHVPAPGQVRFGSFRRLSPFSRTFGYDRGQPVDRHYIEAFLGQHAADIQGRVLEIADNTYTRRFGGSRVTRSDVLHVQDRGPGVTIVADLADGRDIPGAAFDCVILTQTLQLIYELQDAVRTVHRILKPGGVLLATLPGISSVSSYDRERWGQYWSFTSQSAQRLFADAFGADRIEVEAGGNVLAATAFLYGMARQELRPAELQYGDPDYELIISVRAVKS
jgi:SAM-dependent methyltransferase